MSDTVKEVVEPQGLDLRADGMCFLLINLASMIITPWQEATAEKFPDVTNNVELLREDLRDILTAAAISAKRHGRVEISANVLFQATAFFGEGLTVRALKGE